MKKVVILTVIMMVAMLSLYAHVPYMEECDFSFEAPFVVPVTSDGGPPHVMRSKAIFAYMDNNDIDVYQFTLVPSDFQKPVLDGNGNPQFDENGNIIMQFSPVLVTASALPPACKQYKHFYPKTALLGIGLPAPEGDLPFDVPAGYGVIVADHPFEHQREVFTEAGIYWFLPKGLSQDCLFNAPWTCDYTNTISQPIFNPGTYFVVMFNDTGRPGDYTANIGVLEGFDGPQTPEQKAILELVASGEFYKVNCVPVVSGEVQH